MLLATGSFFFANSTSFVPGRRRRDAGRGRLPLPWKIMTAGRSMQCCKFRAARKLVLFLVVILAQQAACFSFFGFGSKGKTKDADQRRLYDAAIAGDAMTVKLLLNDGVEPDGFHGSDGSSALLLAAENGQTDVVFMLLLNGADVNYQRKDGASALIAASAFGRIDAVNLLLENNARTELHDKNGVTAIMFASESGHADVVQALLQARSNPDHGNREGKTALMWAGYHGHTDVVYTLLDGGASPYLQVRQGNL